MSHFGLLEMSRQRMRTADEGSTVLVRIAPARDGSLDFVDCPARPEALEDALIKNASYDIIVKPGRQLRFISSIRNVPICATWKSDLARR